MEVSRFRSRSHMHVLVCFVVFERRELEREMKRLDNEYRLQMLKHC